MTADCMNFDGAQALLCLGLSDEAVSYGCFMFGFERVQPDLCYRAFL